MGRHFRAPMEVQQYATSFAHGRTTPACTLADKNVLKAHLHPHKRPASTQQAARRDCRNRLLIRKNPPSNRRCPAIIRHARPFRRPSAASAAVARARHNGPLAHSLVSCAPRGIDCPCDGMPDQSGVVTSRKGKGLPANSFLLNPPVGSSCEGRTEGASSSRTAFRLDPCSAMRCRA